MKVWIGGRVRERGEALVPVTDHGLLYGDGVFEGMRIAHGGVFRLDAHLERLERSAHALLLDLPGGRSEMRRIVLATARAFGETEAYVRLILTRGEGPLGVDPGRCGPPRAICIVDRIALYPRRVRERGLDLQTSSLRRADSDMLDPRVKSLNYLPSVLAKQEARRSGADEALLLNRAGRVAEAAVANVIAVHGERVTTPPPAEGALGGITCACILDSARDLGLDAREEPLTRHDLLSADEVLLTGSGAGLAPVRSLDGRTIGGPPPGPVTAKLMAAYAEHLRTDITPF